MAYYRLREEHRECKQILLLVPIRAWEHPSPAAGAHPCREHLSPAALEERQGVVLLLWGLSRPKGLVFCETEEQQARGEAGIEGGAGQDKHKAAAQVTKHL